MFSSVPTSVSCRPVVAQRIKRHGQVDAQTVREHFTRDHFDSLDPHQHHLGAPEFGKRAEVDRGFRFFRILMAGEKSDVRIHSAVRDRNSGVGRPGDRRGDSWNYLEGKVRRNERLRLFRATPEQKWISTL